MLAERLALLEAIDEGFKAELVCFVPRLRAFARTLSGSSATGDDLAQETVLRAWQSRESFVMGTNMEAWLFRILRNLHISGVRRSRRAPEHGLDLNTSALAGSEDPSAGVALNDMRQALNLMPAEQREALILVGAVGWSYEEAAVHAGCPLGTMKSRVFRARRALAALIDSGTVLRDAMPASEALSDVLGLARSLEYERSSTNSAAFPG